MGKWLWVTMEGCSFRRAVGTEVRQQTLKTMNGSLSCKDGSKYASLKELVVKERGNREKGKVVGLYN